MADLPPADHIDVFIHYSPGDDISKLQSAVQPFGASGPRRGGPPVVGADLVCGAIAFHLVSSSLLSWFRPGRGKVLVADASRDNADLVVTQISSDGKDDKVVLIDRNGNQLAPIQLNGDEGDNGILQAALRLILGR
jgi:hypothetical protein